MLKHISMHEISAIIAEAEALNAKHPPSPTGIRLGDDTSDIWAYADDEKTLKTLLSTLTKDATMELMALMWIGRDFDGSFEDALSAAHDQSDAHDVGYIAEKSPELPTYLRAGLAKL